MVHAVWGMVVLGAIAIIAWGIFFVSEDRIVLGIIVILIGYSLVPTMTRFKGDKVGL